MNRRNFLSATSATFGTLALRIQNAPTWQRWRLNGDRLQQHLEDLAQFGRTPEGGVRRLAFSQADVEARRFCMGLMQDAGLEVRIDQVGNMIGRRAGRIPDAPPIMFGSHIDTVPNGGKYDGSVGSLAAIEAAQTLEQNGYRTLSGPAGPQ